MREYKNTCEDCYETDYDNHVWDECPACQSTNLSYEETTEDSE